MFDWKVQKLDFQIHINIPQPKVLHILDASNIIIGLKINNIVANIIRIHSFVLITLRGFFKSDYVQPQTHNTLNANFRVSGNVKRAVRDTQTDRWGGGGGGGEGGGGTQQSFTWEGSAPGLVPYPCKPFENVLLSYTFNFDK